MSRRQVLRTLLAHSSILERQAFTEASQFSSTFAKPDTFTAALHCFHLPSAPTVGQLTTTVLPALSITLQQQAGSRLFHNASSVLQQQLQEGQNTNQLQQSDDATKAVAGVNIRDLADAEECDEAIIDLEETRRRVARLKQPPPGQVSLSQRVKQFSVVLGDGIKMTVVFIAGVPKRVWCFARLPRVERKQIYAGWWSVIKKEAKHYWVGTKLLGKDISIAWRLVSKVLRGNGLSRRERQQLTRTTADIFRIVPMLVFVVVPFMELLLPVALKLFPNMLPSTFEDKLKKQEEMKKRISARLEVARFLQDTVAEMASDMQRSKSEETQTSAAELYAFMKRVRAGEDVSPGDLLKFAKLFNDQLTLDNLERVQLVSLCRFVGIQPYGTDAFLRSRLRAHLQSIKGDDREIQEEGLENLTEDELRQACRARGMRAPFGEGAATFMKEQLAEWLDWSLNRSLPSSLLLLSRAFTLTAPIGSTRQPVDVSSIRETLSSMPDEVVEDVELFATTDGDDKVEANERKLEMLEREEELIREEEEAAFTEEEMPLGAGKATAQEMAAAAAAAAVVKEAAAGSLAEAFGGESASAEEKAVKKAEAKKARMRKVLTALAALASGSGVASEREAFMGLVEKEIDRLNSQLETRGVGMVFTKGQLEVDRHKVEEALGQTRLTDRITGILQRVEKELDHVDHVIGDKLHVLDLDNDGIISPDELHTAMTFLKEEMGEDELRQMLESLSAEAGGKDGGIDVNKLMNLALQGEEEQHASNTEGMQ